MPEALLVSPLVEPELEYACEIAGIRRDAAAVVWPILPP